MEPDFLTLMVETVTIKPTASLDNFGNPVSGTSVVVAARIEDNTRVQRGDSKEEIELAGVVYIPPPDGTIPLVSVTDRVTLPDATTRVVQRVDQPYDETGSIHHQKVYLI